MIVYFFKKIFTWFLIFQYAFLSVVQATNSQLIFELQNPNHFLDSKKNQYVLHVRKKEKDGTTTDILKSRIQRDGSVMKALDIPKDGPVQITTSLQGKHVHIQYITENIKEKLGFDITSEGNFTLTSMKAKRNVSFSTFGLLTLDTKTLHATSLSLKGKRIRNNAHLTVDDLTLEASEDQQQEATILNTVSGVMNVKAQMNILKGNIHNEGGIRTQEDTVIDLYNNNLINQDCSAPIKGIESTGKLQILNIGALENSTSLIAKDLVIEGHILTNTGKITANQLAAKAKSLQNLHLMEGKSLLTLSGKKLYNTGTLVGNEIVDVSGFSQIENQGIIQSGKDSNFYQLGNFINYGTVESKDGILKVNAQDLTTYGLIEAKDVVLTINNTLLAHEIIKAKDFLEISAGNLINKTSLLGNKIHLTTQTRFENHKAILAKNKLTVNLTGMSLNNGLLSEEGDIIITSYGSFINKHDIVLQKNLIIEGAGLFDNQANLTATTVYIQGFDHLVNQETILGTNHYNFSFIREFINKGFIQGNHGDITSQDGVMTNWGEIHQATMAIKRLQNKTTGLIKKATVTVSDGRNEGIIKGDDFTVNDNEGFYNQGSIFLQRLLGTGYFHNLSILDFKGKNQITNIIDIHRFLNHADPIPNQIAVLTGSSIEITPNVHSFIIGDQGQIFVQSLSLNGGKGIYKNEGKLTATVLSLSQSSPFSNHHLMTIDRLFVNQDAIFQNNGNLQTKEIIGAGFFYNHHFLTLFPVITGQSIIGVGHFVNDSQNAQVTATIQSKAVILTADVREFILRNGAMKVENIIIEESALLYRSLCNMGEFNADFFTLNQNIFTNTGQMDVTQFNGDKGTCVNQGTLSTLEKARFSQFENYGTAVLEELEVSEKGNNQGTLTLKAISGKGAFINQRLLTFDASIDDLTTIDVFKFINQSDQEKQAEIKGENIVVSKNVTDFLLKSGTFIAHSLSVKDGSGHYENRGDLILMSLLLNKSTTHFMNKGNLQVGVIAGKGTFTNYHLLLLKAMGQQVDQSVVGIARFINEILNADFVAKVIGEDVVFSKNLREFDFRSGIFQSQRLELEGEDTFYQNNGEIQVETLLLNQNTFRNNNLLTITKIEGIVGKLINQGTVASKGKTTFHTLENTGAAYFEELVIDDKGSNTGELNIYSLKGNGHLYNHGKLTFLPQDTKVAQVEIAHLTNESKKNSQNIAEIYGVDVVISSAMQSLTLNQGKVWVKNLTFNGGKIAYENYGEITAEVLTLIHLQQPFVNSNVITINILAVNTAPGFINHGDLQLGSLTGTGTLRNHNLVTFETTKPALMDVPEFINETLDSKIPAQVFGGNIQLSSQLKKFMIQSGTMGVELLDMAPGSTPYFVNRGDFSVTGHATFYDFENHGTGYLGSVIINGQSNNMGALTLDSLKGKGQFYNNNSLTFRSTTDKESEIGIVSFTNAAEMNADHLTITDAVKTVVFGKGKAHITALTLNGQKTVYENLGEMTMESLTLSQPQSSFINHHLMTLDILNLLSGNNFTNKDELQVGAISGVKGTVINDGTLRAKYGLLDYFINNGQASIDAFTLHSVGQNNGLFNVMTLKGQGSFHNQAQLIFKGSTDVASLLGINSFINGGDPKSNAEIKATALIVMPETKTFDLKSGIAEIDFLMIHTGAGESQCSNAGDLITSQLQLNQPRFDNSGYLKASSLEGKITILVNNGEFIVKAQTILPNTHLTNNDKGIASFEGKTQFKEVTANGQLVALQGLEVATWAGKGISEIYQNFKATDVDNQGILHLVEAKTTLPHILTNKGDLRLRQVTFTNAKQQIVNFKNLILENDLTLASLTNHDHVYVESGKYKMENLVNKNKIILWNCCL